MKIAIIGTGISGLTSAYVLDRAHDITVFESDNRIGGHTATKTISYGGQNWAIDTGFIVCNDRTYPNFLKLLSLLGVSLQKTEMSFSVKCEHTGLEYSGSNLNTLYAQRRNLLRPRFHGMVRDILRFNREAQADLDSGRLDPALTLGDYLKSRGYGEAFIKHYLIPMGAAIWSASTHTMQQFPLVFFVRFFKNHGLLSINQRPQWYVIKGGSQSYLEPLTRSFKHRIRTGSPVIRVKRHNSGVTITTADHQSHAFDAVIFACHSDQALNLLADPSSAEQDILGAIPYQDNDVILHTDASLLPQRRLAWAAWNYHLTGYPQSHSVLTYNMNLLQGLNSQTTFCVSLNASEAIDPNTIIGRYRYSHPVFTVAGIQAQSRRHEISGSRHTYYCGAYWANGFHEDGVTSALAVTRQFGMEL